MVRGRSTLEVTARALWDEDMLAGRGLPGTSLRFFWAQAEHGVVALHCRPKAQFFVRALKASDFPDPEATDKEAETRRVIARCDEILEGLVDLALHFVPPDLS